jgi:hypothetical protein
VECTPTSGLRRTVCSRGCVRAHARRSEAPAWRQPRRARLRSADWPEPGRHRCLAGGTTKGTMGLSAIAQARRLSSRTPPMTCISW